MRCISTVSYRISHRGEELGLKFPKRGLREGDPFSPYLFILCVDGLSSTLNDLERCG